jgi:hypothetical protein
VLTQHRFELAGVAEAEYTRNAKVVFRARVVIGAEPRYTDELLLIAS